MALSNLQQALLSVANGSVFNQLHFSMHQFSDGVGFIFQVVTHGFGLLKQQSQGFLHFALRSADDRLNVLTQRRRRRKATFFQQFNKLVSFAGGGFAYIAHFGLQNIRRILRRFHQHGLNVLAAVLGIQE